MKTITILMMLILTIMIFNNSTIQAEEKKTGSTWEWSVDDLLTAERINEYKISPNGEKLAWTINKWNVKEQKPYNILYVTDINNTSNDFKKIRLTYSEDSYNSIQWVPGENKISFKTSKKFKDTKDNNLWVINLDGGEAYPLTSMENGVQQVEWIDKENFLFSGREAKSLYEQEQKEKKDTSEVVEDEEHRVITRLFSYNLKTKKIKRLTDNLKPILRFYLSPDKKWVIYTVNMSIRSVVDQEIRDKYYLMNISSGENKEIFESPSWKPLNFSWSLDSSSFYIEMAYTSHPKYTFAPVNKLYLYTLNSKKLTEVNLQWERYVHQQGTFPTKDGVIVKLLDGVYVKYARYIKKGETWQREWIKEEIQKNIFSLQLADNGKTMVYGYSTSSEPPRFYLAELKGNHFIKKAEIMKFESSLSKKPMAKSEIITWEGARGDMVEGILFYPYNYKAGNQYPLILIIHGGPHAADRDVFSTSFGRPTHLLAERGAFILKVNYHGSSSYGLEFGESIAGHYYEYEIPDIEKGVDKLIAEKKVDKNQLGVIGWSNGSILGIQLLIHSNRYKAASLGAGDVNWISDYGNCAFGVAFDNYYFGGPPWENIETYIKKSPLFQLTKVTTPTLIFHGDKDKAVPYEQGWEFYRALQQIGKAPVRFISFPGEGHGPQKLAHQRRKLKEEISWFEKYLFKTTKEKNKALKKGSPLEQLDKYLNIAKIDGLYGIKKDGILIPETVEFNNLVVGRFEITRAQWAAYSPGYKYQKETENNPITNITSEQAQAYIQWLNKKTGEVYRLPEKKEVTILYKNRSGNTFDYWAGYTLNPDDYKKLKTELAKYKDNPVLLKPVGSFSPLNDEPVFDLDGNAAEWVIFEDQKAKACGGSAERPIDDFSPIEPLPEYIGFRIIKVISNK